MFLLAYSLIGFFKDFLMLVCVLSALLLLLVVLLQEPKGGGLSSAFGGAGAETFGVQTGSVNKFTSYVALAFMSSALLYAAIRPDEEALLSTRPPQTAPEESGDAGNAAGDDGNAAPSGNGGAPADDVEKKD